MSEHHPLNSDICHVVNDQVMTLMKNTITHVPHVVWMDGRADARQPFFTHAVSPVKQTILRGKVMWIKSMELRL